MKLLKKLLFLIVFLLVVLVLARNYVVKIGAEQFVKQQTGLPLKMEGINIGLVDTKIDIDDLKLYNPPNFEEKLMVNIPDIYVDYNLPEIIKGNIHLNEIRFHLNEVIIVKNKAGQTNIDALKALQQPKQEGDAPKKEEPKPKAEKKKGGEYIGKASFRVDRFTFKDYSGDGEPKIITKDIGLNKTYKDIDSFNKLVALIVVDATVSSGLSDLVNITSAAQLLGNDLLNQAGGTIKGVADGLLKGSDSLTEKAKGLKGLFKKD
ncbi:MAG: hypothetical protein KC900_04425 [Candidatus Omnitrophica bacterium]|nr:hypothetical protein [Candidatus Omnitrophota bacterium]